MPKAIIEQFYMMSVSMYLYDFESLRRFCFVSKKCQEATAALKINPNFQDSLYYRKKCCLKERTELFKKELKFFCNVDTLRGSFSMISSFPKETIQSYSLFDLFHEGCGSGDLFREIQPKITALEFVSNGRFEGTADMPLLKKFKVIFLNEGTSNTNVLKNYIDKLIDVVSKPTLRNLQHFVLVCFGLDDMFIPLLKAIKDTHFDCQIGICVKGNVSEDNAKAFTKYATVIQTSKEAMFYGELDKELRVVALKDL